LREIFDYQFLAEFRKEKSGSSMTFVEN